MFRYTLVLLAGLGSTAPAWAGSWADGMFAALSKDFGSVPRGGPLQYSFRFTNNTGQKVHVSSVRVSCGCVSAAAEQNDIDPGQAATINATMDTQRFLGVKRVTIYVQFDQPQFEEVRLWVQANSRDDVSVNPEAFALGVAKRGSQPAGTVTVTLLGGDWKVDEVQRESNYIQTALKETGRGGNSVTYELTAKIRADAPVGKWYSDVWLKTSNPSLPRVRVPLTVEIESPLSVTPTAVQLGQVKSGGTSERKVIVRGVQPFKIKSVQGTDDQLSIKDSVSDSKPVHVLTLTLTAKKPGDLERTFKVITDLAGDGEIEFMAKATVAK
jgi:hypothetical protein